MSAVKDREVREEVVRLSSLRDVHRRPPLPRYVGQLWDRRHFIRADARGRLVSGTRSTFLGMAWLVLKPVLDGAVYYLIFGVLLELSRGIDNFVAYLLIGVFLFQFTARCLTGGAQSVTGGRSLIRSFSFPRAALPVSVVTREVLNLAPVVAVLLLLVLLLPPAEPVTWRWLLFPLVLALQAVFAFGLALLAARAVARIPDLSNLLSFGLRIWLYGSAVFFSFDRFVEDPELQRLLELNPMFIVLDMSRDVLIYATTPDLSTWLVLTAWAVGSAVLGLVFFWRGEESYGSV